jgi:hypothetical protein
MSPPTRFNLKRNYVQCNDEQYMQTWRLATGALASAIFPGMYLQGLEQVDIYQI